MLREAVVRLWGASKQDEHTYEEDIAYFRENIAPRCKIWVAEEDGELTAFLALAGSYL